MYSALTLDDPAALEVRFARAARHSRLVRFLRVSIPSIVGAALLGVMALSLFNPFRVANTIPNDTDNLVVSGTKITMESPHMTGYSVDLRPYEIWGRSAIQDTTDPDNVDLVEPRGKMLMEDGATMNVESRTGRMNNKTQILDLYKEVYVTTTSGYEARLNHAQVDLNAGAVATDDGVNVKFDGGKVKADRLRLTDHGEVVRFDGHVVMDIDHVDAPQSPPVDAPVSTRPTPTPAPRAEAPKSSAKPRSLVSSSAGAK